MLKLREQLRRWLRKSGLDLHLHGPRFQSDVFDKQAAWLRALDVADPNGPSLTGIVFSKDRAVQLAGLLASYAAMVEDPAPLKVIYAASSDRHTAAYRDVFASAPEFVEAVSEQDLGFHDTLLLLLRTSSARRIFFLVDDILFLRQIKLSDIAPYANSFIVPSLRLGLNITESQIEGRRTGRYATQQPPFVVSLNGLHFWRFRDGERGWTFPLSVDGHIFLRDELLQMLNNSPFHSPTSLEGAFQVFEPLFKGRFGVCYATSALVNNPSNSVQSELSHPTSNEMSADELLENWESGFEIDVTRYYNLTPRSFHQELPIHLRPRPAGRDEPA